MNPGRLYCVLGNVTGSRITWAGRVIVHDHRGEMEFLFPKNRIVPVTIRAADYIEARFVPGNEGCFLPNGRLDYLAFRR
ncbi:hypothetical protein ACWFMI_23540 [Nocardiopsis terrae]|uniref:hypothetical protein n=1 Tax=Streptomyces sp. NPDC057554 TaxID=3350538 RepID=UPI0036CA862B